MLRYKLVSECWKTRVGEDNETSWSIGETVVAKGFIDDLCSDGVLHYYYSPIQAALFNPIHAGIVNPRLLLVECNDEVATDGLNGGCKIMTPLKEIELPSPTTNQRIAFAIMCALDVDANNKFSEWGYDWLSGADRSLTSTVLARKMAASPRASINANSVWACATAAAAHAAHMPPVAAEYAGAAAVVYVEAAVTPLDFESIYHRAMEELK